MSNIKESIELLNSQRSKCFISFSHMDSEIANRFNKCLNDLNVKVWAMYERTGKDANKGGDDYKKEIDKKAHESCIVVILVSHRSLVSDGVKDELEVFRGQLNDCTHPVIKYYPVIIEEGIHNEDVKPYMIEDPETNPSNIIAKKYLPNNDPDDKQLIAICEEIKEQYICSIIENSANRIKLIKDADKFSDLLNRCIKHDCDAREVSEDIKNSPEADRSGENEIHVLTKNDMKAYDINTYALMVIAGNLLGEPIEEGKTITFDPENNGTKYFYYVTKDYLQEAKFVMDALKKFIKKSDDARQQVAEYIRKDFCKRNGVLEFFERIFEEKTKDQILTDLGVDKESDIALFDPLFEEAMDRGYFAYKNENSEFVVRFKLQDEFISWLNGEIGLSNFKKQQKVVSDFISFLNKFMDLLKGCSETNVKVSTPYKRLKEETKNLERLQQVDKWQNRSLNLKPFEAKMIVDYLLTHSPKDDSNKRVFPHLQSWLNFSYDEEGNIVDIPDEIVEKAFKRCRLVTVSDFDDPYTGSRLLKLCYSFVLFITKKGIDGAWYTTGSHYAKGDGEVNLVTTYSIEDAPTEEHAGLIDAFKYLLEVNPSAKKILEEAGSKLVEKPNKK